LHFVSKWMEFRNKSWNLWGSRESPSRHESAPALSGPELTALLFQKLL
jgi:hypothetical protein